VEASQISRISLELRNEIEKLGEKLSRLATFVYTDTLIWLLIAMELQK